MDPKSRDAPGRGAKPGGQQLSEVRFSKVANHGKSSDKIWTHHRKIMGKYGNKPVNP
jgi:hypothetical protein